MCLMIVENKPTHEYLISTIRSDEQHSDTGLSHLHRKFKSQYSDVSVLSKRGVGLRAVHQGQASPPPSGQSSGATVIHVDHQTVHY